VSGYGGGDGGPWRPADGQPQRGDSGRQRDQANIWSQDQGGAGYGDAGYDSQNHSGQNRSGQNYGGQNYDGQGHGGQDHNGSGYGQPGGRPANGPGPSYRPQGRQGQGTGAQQYPRTGPEPVNPGTGARVPGPGTGPRPTRRGSDAMPQEPAGYGQRGAGPRRAAARYGDDHPAGDDSFLPGFGPREDFDRRDDLGGRRGQGRISRDRGPYQDEPGYDQAYDGPRGPRGADPRQADPRQADPRPRDGRDQAALQEGRRPDGRRRDDRGPDPRDSGERQRDHDNWDMRNDRPRRKATRWVPRILLLVIFGGLVAGGLVGGLFVYHKYEAKYHPADFAGAGTVPTVTVQVMSGETPSGLAPTLVKLGIIASDRAFTNAAEASANPTAIEPGFFTLNHHMQASVAYAALLNPKNRVQLGVTIPEGKRASQVALILSKETKIPLKNFQQVIAHPAKLGLPSYADGKVEGYLFPATYAIVPHETALQILQAMVARFNAEATAIDLPAAAARVNLTSGQVITEASMAQAEGGSISDFPKIAEVITNRLRIGMHLQFDSTVVYGLGKYSTSATFAELKINTPYNTYLHAGLPAGPISNPGDAAIQGILNQDKGDFLYFLTVSGGKSKFSPTPLTGQ
jgi:uncharacterized YceG family protein